MAFLLMTFKPYAFTVPYMSHIAIWLGTKDTALGGAWWRCAAPPGVGAGGPGQRQGNTFISTKEYVEFYSSTDPARTNFLQGQHSRHPPWSDPTIMKWIRMTKTCTYFAVVHWPNWELYGALVCTVWFATLASLLYHQTDASFHGLWCVVGYPRI